MNSIHIWFEKYGESHQNPTNKIIHWICIPLIIFSLIGLLWCVPHNYFNDFIDSDYLNWGSIFIICVLFYYTILSINIAVGMFILSLIILYGNHYIANYTTMDHLLLSIYIFIVAWVGQFIGHKIEGKKPSFFEDLQFLLIGPAWLIGFIYRILNIKY